MTQAWREETRAPTAMALAASHTGPVAEAIAHGFHDNEAWVYIQPDPVWRHRLMVRNYRVLIRRLFLRRGAGWTTSGLEGAALWIPPGEPKRTRADLLAESASLVPWVGSGLRRAYRLDEMVEAHHPSEPHWYLEVLSVHPAHQRRGLGSALIAPGLARCDAEGMPAYLETQRKENLPYYERFGFEEREIMEAPGVPPLWGMWREPR